MKGGLASSFFLFALCHTRPGTCMPGEKAQAALFLHSKAHAVLLDPLALFLWFEGHSWDSSFFTLQQ